MAAVIRLKRRVDEDPFDAFVLNCKRQRTDSDQDQQGASTSDIASSSASPSETSTVLKFAGTFPKADSIPTALRQSLKRMKGEATETMSRLHQPRIASRNREATRQNSQNSRFRIVNYTRSLSQVEGEDDAPTTIVDVERDNIAAASSSSSSGGEAQPAEGTGHDPGYVYDLYVVDDSQPQVHVPFDPELLERDGISVAIYADPLYSCHGPLGDRSDSADDDSEDSNDENNWRNEYPDEDDDVFGDYQSVDEEDMRYAVQGMDISGDRELSSDDDDDDDSGNKINLYDDDGDGDDEYHDADEHGLNQNDVNMFGLGYARHKARYMTRYLEMSKNAEAQDENGEEYDSEISDDGDKSSGSESEEALDLYD